MNEHITLLTDAECQAYDRKVFEVFANETQATKNCNIQQPSDGFSRYDALINGFCYCELKHRTCTSSQFKTYYANRDKIDHLNSCKKDGERVYFVCLFADRWYTVDVTDKTFPHAVIKVHNPKKGEVYEDTYFIDPTQINGTLHDYRTVSTPLKIRVEKPTKTNER